jgi:molecular chaperone DnaK
MVRKALAEHGDKIGADEKTKIEAALKATEEAMKAGDKDDIEGKTRDLAQLAQKLGEKMYSQAGAGAHGPDGGSSEPAGQKRDEGDVVDAEFEEVKDKKG